MTNVERLNKTLPGSIKSGNLPFVVGEYNFTSLLGRGGFSEVYLVEHMKFGINYVAKVMIVDTLDTDPKWDLVEAEIKALSQLDHPNIIRLYDHFHNGNRFYLILEYCVNGCLHDQAEIKNGLSMQKFVEYGSQIVSALNYCHSKGISHHDIKPGNILIDGYGKIKVADFGLSLESNGSKQKSFGGSYQYTAPEIFMKKAHDPKKADVWALGVMFVFMATGSSPWPCDSLGALKQLAVTGQYRLSKGIPMILSELIKRMIVVDPDQRISMHVLAQHPLFKDPPKIKAPPKKIDRPNWEQIPRLAPITAVEQVFMDDLCLCPRYSSIHCASSSIVHNAPVPQKVSTRLHRHSNPLKPTFHPMDDFVEVT